MSRGRSILIAVGVLTAAAAADAQDARTKAEAAFRGDVHQAAGLQCADCHTASGRKDASEYSPVGRTAIAPMCARCHGDPGYMRKFDPQVRVDQFAQYQTSGHGKAMARGETRVATCSDCHGAHGVVRVRDLRSPVAPLNAAKTCARCHADAPLMTAMGKDATPFADWSSSVHAVALLKRGDTSAPTCNTCHGSHGAAPPGVTEIANVCAQCHAREADLFRASPKKAIFDGMGQAECLVCHNNHAIHAPSNAMVGLAEPAVCATCHDASSNGAQTITTFRTKLDELDQRMTAAQAVIDRAEHAGMLVDAARTSLQQAHEQQIQTRVLVHSFSVTPFEEPATRGLAAAARAEQMGHDALAELQTRRVGLFVATIFIFGFLVTLAIKIRRLPVPEP